MIAAAALVYFLIVFACAFLMGMFRVLVMVPAIGEMAAVAIEVPLILVISWFAAARTIAHFQVAARAGQRLGMGGLAFGILMLAEAGLAHFAFATPWPAYWADLRTAPGLLGLAGQILFALVPVLRLVIVRR